MGTLNGNATSRVTLHLPAAGCWRADVAQMSGDVAPAEGSSAVLTVGSLTLHGTVQHAGLDQPYNPRAVVVGGLGWDRLVSAPLAFDGGVRLSTVLQALAEGSGEHIEQPPNDHEIGSHYTLPASTTGRPVRYRDALQELLAAHEIDTWRVDADGVTRFTTHTPAEVATRLTERLRSNDVGLSTYSIDDPLTVLPGNTIAGRAITRVTVRDASNKLEADVYWSGGATSLEESIRRIVAEEIRHTVATYTVDSVDSDGKCNLRPPPDATHLPELKNVEQWCVGGSTTTAAPGSECLVLYRDERRTRPVVVAFDRAKPTKSVLDGDKVQLGKTGMKGVAGIGNSVTVMLPPATFTGTISGAPASGMLIFSTGQTMGTITEGSVTVERAD